jgi:hypothetical protein
MTTTTVIVTAADLDNTSSDPAVVRVDGLNKWFMYNDDTDTIDNMLGSFVVGPGAPHHGRGSVQFTLGTSQQQLDRENIATYQFSGTLLASITEMAFSAYSHSGVAGPTESPFLNFNADFDGSDSFQGRLVYVPSANGALVPQDTWNTFDVIDNGNALWTWSHFAGTWPAPDGNPTNHSSQYRTWNDIIHAFPGIRILPSDGWLGIRVGEPGPTGYTGNVDSFTLGTTNGPITTFDFDLAMTVTAQDITAFTGAANAFNGQVATGAYSGQGTLSATITWGDDMTTAGMVVTNGTTFTVSGSHTYATAGNDILAVTVTNTVDGVTSAPASDSSTATVLDVPTVMAQNITIFAGATFSGQVASGTYSGQGTLAATINWGDGTTTPGTVATSGTAFTVNGSHTYTAAGSPTLMVTVTNTMNGVTSAPVSSSSTATVSIPALAVMTQPITATEGTAFSGQVATGTFTSGISGPFSATINWGDGTTTAGTVTTSGTSFMVNGSHTYAEEGNYSFTVTVSNTSGHSASSSSTATVADAALTLTLLTVAGFIGHLGILELARFSDANTLSTVADFTATVAWGDGTTSTAPITSLGHGNYAVGSVRHTYASAGPKTVTLTIRDVGGSQVSGSQTITVS